MIDLGPFVLAQADEHHLHQAAFDVADEARVRLDAVADQHVVGLEGVAVEVDGKPSAVWPTTTVSMLERIGQPQNASVMPYEVEHLALPLGRAAAVAAHGRHDERLAAQRLEVLDDRLGDQVDVGDAAAAGGDGHGLAGLDPRRELQLFELRARLGGHVGHLGRRELLPQAKNRRE